MVLISRTIIMGNTTVAGINYKEQYKCEWDPDRLHNPGHKMAARKRHLPARVALGRCVLAVVGLAPRREDVLGQLVDVPLLPAVRVDVFL